MVSQLCSDILMHLGQLTGFRAGHPVSQGALRAALASNPPSVALDEAARSLLEDGFVAATPWVLTPKGLDRSRSILWMFPGSDEPPVSEPAIVREEVPPSPWADDPAGVVVLESVSQDKYSSDSYIQVLGISQSNCFGGFRKQSPVCEACPIIGSCQTQQFLSFSEVSATLNRRVAAEGGTPPTVTPGIAPSDRDKALRDILDDIIEPATAPSGTPVERGILKTVSVRSVCSVCFRTLEEGTQALFVTGKGYRHPNPCK